MGIVAIAAEVSIVAVAAEVSIVEQGVREVGIAVIAVVKVVMVAAD